MTKNYYRVSASLFVSWVTQRAVKPRVAGLIEHFAHHKAVLKYQQSSVPAGQLNLQVEPTERDEWFEQESMPEILRQATIEKSELDIECYHTNLCLIGRVDQLYLLNGFGILSDTKSHATPTFRDQLQLSFYAFILQSNGYQMADFAYIRCAHGGVSYHVVDLIPTEVMKEIFQLM
jgi:hypothetical protein